MPKKLTKEEFIERAKEIHRDRYNYSLVEYKNSTTDVVIICPIHGEFKQLPTLHLKGRGCQKCGGSKQLTKEEFIEKAKKVHGDKYDYSLVEYKNSTTRVKLICKEHGEFEVVPSKHIHRNFGCQKCGIKKRSEARKNKDFDVIERFKETHGNLYDYSNFEYINFYTPSTIICKKHGEFQQNSYNHIKGHGCPVCGNLISNKENDLKNFIKSFNFEIKENSRNIIPPKELDIFLPEYNLAIEYNGLYWHSEKMLEKNGQSGKKYHLDKTKELENKGIRLIHIFEDEWLFKEEIVKNRIKHILGIHEVKIGGRKTNIREISSKEKNEFLNKYHIQGTDNSSIKIGAFYDNELVSVMTFGKKRISLGSKGKNNSFELIRFATKFGVLSQGIASKLFKHFLNTYTPEEIISYSDKRWNTGNLYEKMGFEYSHTSSPNYWYIKKNKRLHRFGFRKQNLPNILKTFDKNLTEYENMLNNGYDRIWDCGNDVWVYRK